MKYKLKINWGTGIVLAIISFMTFILFLVITMTTNQEFNHDLVVEEYYKQELTFQDQLNRESNALNLESNIDIEIAPQGVIVSFPGQLDPARIQGSIVLYRPSNKEMDFMIPISLKDDQLLIPAALLDEGRWNIVIDWSYMEESYYFKEDFTF